VIAPESTAQALLETTPTTTSWGPVMDGRVRVPDGRVGKVIGFYRRDTDTALVKFAADQCAEFPMSDIEPCRRLGACTRFWIGWD
jgi:hypothetical protein